MPVLSLMRSKSEFTTTTGRSKSSTSTGVSTQPSPASNSLSKLATPHQRRNRARIATGTIEAESLLWRHVLSQAVRDIYDRDVRIREEAMRWVLSPDFLTVCDFAFVEPDSMKEQIANLAMMPMILALKFGPQLRDYIVREEA